MSKNKNNKKVDFIDEFLKYELSKKETVDRLNWLKALDEENGRCISHIVNDLKDVTKGSKKIKKRDETDFQVSKNLNNFYSKQIAYMKKQIDIQSKSIKVLQDHIIELTGKSVKDINGEIEKKNY